MKKLTETPSLLFSQSKSKIIDKKVAVRVTNTTDIPYTMRKNTPIANFSVVTPEQSTFTRPVDIAILNMNPDGDPDLTSYLNELLR